MCGHKYRVGLVFARRINPFLHQGLTAKTTYPWGLRNLLQPWALNIEPPTMPGVQETSSNLYDRTHLDPPPPPLLPFSVLRRSPRFPQQHRHSPLADLTCSLHLIPHLPLYLPLPYPAIHSPHAPPFALLEHPIPPPAPPHPPTSLIDLIAPMMSVRA